MAEYTFKNIIIDPTKEGIESLIGKEVYVSNIPSFCLDYANDNEYSNLGVLTELKINDSHPFVVKHSSCSSAYICIIPKEPILLEYEPFESTKEFTERYKETIKGFDFDSFNDDHFQDGMWLKRKNTKTDVYCMVAGICNNMVDVCNKKTTIPGEVIFNDRMSLCELYHKYTFPDGSPCGRLKESK